MRLSEAITVLGVVLLAVTLVLPLVKVPQTLTITFTTEGPSAPYQSINYAISGYRIPPVDQGTMINISLADISPDPVLVLLIPGNGVTTGPYVYSAFTVLSSFFASVRSPVSQPYTLVISSFNETTYSLQVKSVWSPYYDAGNYTVEALFVILVGVGGFFYFRETRIREELEASVAAQFQKKSERVRKALTSAREPLQNA